LRLHLVPVPARAMMERRHQRLGLSVFAIAMAFVEAAVVVYVRQIYYPEDPRIIFPLNILSPHHLVIEWLREAATLAMILSVAWLAERGFMRVFAAFVYIFGLWDIFYYLWLKLSIGWPTGWLDWDILFLIPWVWLGPWIAPASIAALFVAWGGWVLGSPRSFRFTYLSASLFVVGAGLDLAAFLQPAFPLLTQGIDAIEQFSPAGFWWALFATGYLLMAAGLLLVLRGAGNGHGGPACNN